MLGAIAAALTAVSPTLVSVAPFAVATAVGLAIVATHDREADRFHNFNRFPEATADCMVRNVKALDSRLVAFSQPLYGSEVYDVTVKRGVVGEPVLRIVLTQTSVGAHAEVIPLVAPEQQPDVLAKIVAGC